MNAKTCLFVLAAALAAHTATAQEPIAPPPAVAPVPDATYRALRDRVVVLHLRDGSQVVGQVLSDDSAVVTVAIEPSRRVCTVAKYDIMDVQLASAPAPAPAAASAAPGEPADLTLHAQAPAPERERHFGLNFGFSPSVDLDLDYGMFHGFLNANLVLPMASDGQILGFGAGGGVSFHVRPGSHWKLDVFAAVTPARFGLNGDGTNDWAVGLGVGFGAHYTAHNGFTVGFKAPVLGYAVGSSSLTSSSSSAVGMYYLTGLMGMPVVSLGYRF